MRWSPMTGLPFCASGSIRSANPRLSMGCGAAATSWCTPIRRARFWRGEEEQRKHINLTFSIGVELDDKEKDMEGIVSEVIWDSPAFKAGITEGDQILAINGITYDVDVLKDAIRAAAGGTKPPIELIVKSGDRFKVAHLDYHDGLRYPHLEREASEPARIDDILAARPN